MVAGIDPVTLLVGVVAVFVVVVGAILFTRWFTDDTDDQAKKVQEEARREGVKDVDYTIGVVPRFQRYNTPSKVIIVCAALLMTGLAVYLYVFFQHGGPTRIPHAQHVETASIALIGAVGGGWVVTSRRRSRAYLHIIHEDDDGGEEHTEKIPFNLNEVDRTKDGNMIVYEEYPIRALGMWGKKVLAGEDPELRGRVADPSDIVSHEIPSHATILDDRTIEVRTQGRETTPPGQTAVHYRYRSPIHVGYTEHLSRREKHEKMQSRMDSLRATLAQQEREIMDLREKNAMDVDEQFDEILDTMADVKDVFQDIAGAHHTTLERHGGRRAPKSQREVVDRENGTTQEARS